MWEGIPSRTGVSKISSGMATRCDSFPDSSPHPTWQKSASSSIPSEPTFVPAAGSDPAGDEGWVLFYMHDENRNESELVILDASDWSARPTARVRLPQRVPYGFHGSWIPA